jgi:ATP-binding cassette subfamily F protein 3
MLSVQKITVQFGQRRLFDEVSFLINKTDCIGLVGRNGAGKSTLLKVIAGLQSADSGEVAAPKDFTLGYLPQEMVHNDEELVIDEASSAFEEVNQIQERIEEINVEISTRTDYESDIFTGLLNELNDLNDRLQVIDGFQVAEKVERVLFGLGFEAKDLTRKLGEFSGGWKMRVELAKVLLKAPDLILLDEPTNHLDIESIQWLEDFLKSNGSAILLISHDRTFLDTVTNRTVEISLGQVHDYKFSYSKYITVRAEERERQADAAKGQKKYVEHTQELINKFRAKKNKAAFAQSLIKKLDKLERIEVDDEDKASLKISFPPSPRSGKVALEAKAVGKSYGDLEVLSGVDFLVGRGERIAFIGKNGVGKSTLTRCIVQEEQYEGELALGHNIEIGYYAQNQAELLNPKKTVLATIEDEITSEMKVNARSLLGAFLFSGEDVDKKVKVLSGGERSRLAFCKLLLKPYNLLVLDEPTNHLDIRSKEVLKKALMEYDGTLILVSHDRDFLDGLTNMIYEFQKGAILFHHGGIFEFLEARKLDSMRELERKDVAQKVPKSQAKSGTKLSYEDRKQRERDLRKLNNRLSKCEREIDELEKKVVDMDAEVAAFDHTDTSGSSTLLAKYNTVKTKLDETMQLWEETQALLDELNVEA